MKLRILLDCDGVMADMVGASLLFLESRFGLKYTHDHVGEYDMAKALGLTPEQDKTLKMFWGSESIHSLMTPIPGGAAGVKSLIADGHDVRVITTPFDSAFWIPGRLRWLGAFGIPPDHVIFAHPGEKPFVSGDVFVDDRACTVSEWARARNHGLPILFEQPWSGSRNPGTYAFPIRGWDMLLRVIKG